MKHVHIQIRRVLFICCILFAAAASGMSADEYLLIPVTGTIDGGLALFIERGIENAVTSDADGIIFHVDTPGGRIDSAVEIKDAILDAPLSTTAFVDKNAISAGALISLACDNIYMTTGASIGAATAVDLEGQKASEKVISYFRAQMRATAEANGRRADIAEAMVDETLIIDGISSEGSLVTLTYSEALEYGISDGTTDTIADVLAELEDEPVRISEFTMNWAEQVVRMLTHPMVSSLLMSVGFLGLLIEIRTPGWGIGGTIALVALALFFGSHYLVRLAGVEELLLLAVGIVLLVLEIFVIPGFGIAGIGGIVLILLSLYFSLIGSLPTQRMLTNAGFTMAWAALVTITLSYILIRTIPQTPLFKKLVLSSEEKAVEGYVAAAGDTELIGKTGTTLNNLRPVGKARINGRRYDVITEGEYISAETPVRVTRVEGTKVIVREDTA